MGNVKCMCFPPERVCCRRDNATRGSKSFPSMPADEMQTQSNQSGPDTTISRSNANLPSAHHVSDENHSVGESPNLCKHTVSIDLFRGDMSLLGLTGRLRFSGAIKDDLGKTASRGPGFWKQPQP